MGLKKTAFTRVGLMKKPVTGVEFKKTAFTRVGVMKTPVTGKGVKKTPVMGVGILKTPVIVAAAADIMCAREAAEVTVSNAAVVVAAPGQDT